MNSEMRETQIALCKKYQTQTCEVFSGDIVGISQTALKGVLPINGLRHLEKNRMSCWYIWGGELLSESAGFFKPFHVGHLESHCMMALKFLLLPPGWRFLTDGVYEDVWFDSTLLNVED